MRLLGEKLLDPTRAEFDDLGKGMRIDRRQFADEIDKGRQCPGGRHHADTAIDFEICRSRITQCPDLMREVAVASEKRDAYAGACVADPRNAIGCESIEGVHHGT
ncbi:MAG: hypothetical protein ABW151_06495 [Pseudorhodoplanes sp.]